MLFSTKNSSVEESFKKGIEISESAEIGINEFVVKDIKEALGNLDQGKSYHYISDNTWSLHELLTYCVDHVGKCSLLITAYSIKEQPARAISELKDKGLLQEVFCLFDSSIDKTCEAAMQIIKEVTKNIGYAEIHAKCVVIIGETKSICIVGSQNFTKNKRIEFGVVSVSREVSEFRANFIKQMINDSNEHH